MNQLDLKKEFLNYIKEDLCENALDTIKKYVDLIEIDDDLKSNFIYDIGFIKGRLTRLNQDKRKGVIEYNIYSINRNRITQDTLDTFRLIEDMEIMGEEDIKMIFDFEIAKMWRKTAKKDSLSSYEEFLNEYPHATQKDLALSRLSELKIRRKQNEFELNTWFEIFEDPDYIRMISYLGNNETNVFNKQIESLLIRSLEKKKFWTNTLQNAKDWTEFQDGQKYLWKNEEIKFSKEFEKEIFSVLKRNEENHWKRVKDKQDLFDFIDYYLLYSDTKYSDVFKRELRYGPKASRWYDEISNVENSYKLKEFLEPLNSKIDGVARLGTFFLISGYPILILGWYWIDSIYLIEHGDVGFIYVHYVVLFLIGSIFIPKYKNHVLINMNKEHKLNELLFPLKEVEIGGAFKRENVTLPLLVIVFFVIVLLLIKQEKVQGYVLNHFFLHVVITSIIVISFFANIYKHKIEGSLDFFFREPKHLYEWRIKHAKEFPLFNSAINKT